MKEKLTSLKEKGLYRPPLVNSLSWFPYALCRGYQLLVLGVSYVVVLVGLKQLIWVNSEAYYAEMPYKSCNFSFKLWPSFSITLVYILTLSFPKEPKDPPVLMTTNVSF